MKTRDKYSYFVKNNKTYINSMGLMSATSLDGLDIAFIRTDGLDKFELKNFHTFEYSKSFKNDIIFVAIIAGIIVVAVIGGVVLKLKKK